VEGDTPAGLREYRVVGGLPCVGEEALVIPGKEVTGRRADGQTGRRADEGKGEERNKGIRE